MISSLDTVLYIKLHIHYGQNHILHIRKYLQYRTILANLRLGMYSPKMYSSNRRLFPGSDAGIPHNVTADINCAPSSHFLDTIATYTTTVLRQLSRQRRFIYPMMPKTGTLRFEWNFRWIIIELILVIDVWNISCETALRWISLDLTDDKLTSVQIMILCRHATSHYLSQYWLKSMSFYCVTRPQ